MAKGPSTEVASVTPNGVVIDLKAPGDATLAVETEQGDFKVPLADLADGRPASLPERSRRGAAGASPAPPWPKAPTPEDFPAAAADAGAGAWVVYVVHKPLGPEVLESFTERPKGFADFAPKGGGDQIKLVHFADGRPRRADRRHRARPRRLAPGGRRRRRGSGRRRLVGERAREFRPLPSNL